MQDPRLRYVGLTLLAILALTWSIQAQAQEGTDEEKLQLGGELYATNCAVCHGPNGEGRVGATLAKNWPSIRADLRVKTTIENGVEGSPMPAWSQKNGGPLGDEDINDLVAFILSWVLPADEPEPTHTPTEEAIVEPEPIPTEYPVPIEEQGTNKGLIIGAIVLVLIVVIGVSLYSR